MNRPPQPAGTERPLKNVFSRAGWIVLAVLLAGADLAVKAVVEAQLSQGQFIYAPIVDIQLGYNTGMAFSIGADLPAWVISTVTGIIIAGLLGYLWHQSRQASRLQLTGLTAILGGAAGNLIDRLDGSGVVDYFHTGWFPTFNLADILITLGAGTVILSALVNGRRASGETAPQHPGNQIGLGR